MAEDASLYRAELAALAPSDIPAYLTRHSGLPGPRANLTLMAVAGDLLPEALVREHLSDPDEYLACCAVVGLGRLILAADDRSELVDRLTAAAADDRWRVREAAAIAVQRIGDRDAALLRQLVADWVAHRDPLVKRAGIAAICEPRLLADPLTAAAALAACAEATAALVAVPAAMRRSDSVRVLRQGLAYCWSVAVAGSPDDGLAQFRAISTEDPDVAWVIKQNLAKQRMKKLL